MENDCNDNSQQVINYLRSECVRWGCLNENNL
jgi:hypothetical protein